MIDLYSRNGEMKHGLGPGQSMSEIALLKGQIRHPPIRAAGASKTIEFGRDTMLSLMARVPESSVLSAFTLPPRRLGMQADLSSIGFLSEDRCPDVRRVAEFFNRNKILWRC